MDKFLNLQNKIKARQTMKYIRYILSTLLLYLFYNSISAQNISFQHLTTDDGLSHNAIMSIYQDERGFMWFGTRNGISLYNGKDFKIFQKEKDNPNSILYNDVNQILGDQHGHVFVLGNKGVSLYDIRINSFKHLTRNYTRSGYYNNGLYITNGHCIEKYENDTFKEIFCMPENKGHIDRFKIYNDSIFIGTIKNGLYIYTPKKELVHPIKEGSIRDILKDSRGNYWITDNSGHGVYFIQAGKIIQYKNHTGDSSTLNSNFTHVCCEDKQGNIWIGTFSGLSKYNWETGTFNRYTQQDNSKSLTHNSIWSLYCDHQGTVWVGTYFGGVNYFNPDKQIYREYQTSAIEHLGLSAPIIGRILEDKEENLWICTEGGGLTRYNTKTQTYKWYLQDNTHNGLSQKNVRSIYYDKKNNTIWLGTHLGGLNKLDIQTGYIKYYKHVSGDETTIPSDNVEDIIPYQDKLILATDNYMGLFNPATGKCEPLFKNEEKRYQTGYTLGALIDHTGMLWIANNNNGLCTYHFGTQKLTSYKVHDKIGSISSNSINSIYEDSAHRIWVCTNENGLDLYNQAKDCFENFDMKKNGLSSNIIYNICELSANELLVTTDKGFSILDYTKKRFTNYDQLPLSCINWNALYKNPKGEIFIGGTSGFISFYPEDLKKEVHSYQIRPYQLRVNGKEITTENSHGVLDLDISYAKLITLKSHQNVFSIEYASTDYIPFNKDEIVYRLEGFSKEWSKLGNNPITFTNLNPGTYQLIVKAAGIDPTSVKPSILKIKILPPFYQTVWAYILYILCTGLLAYYLIRMYYRRIRLQESLKYEKKHNEDIEKLNQTKLRFFTNISHEFRTPLTLIIAHMEMLLQVRSFMPNIYNRILQVYKSCLQMQDLITELLDFRKQELGHMTIKVSRHNIVSFVYEHYLLFQEYAMQKQIEFHFEKSSDDIPLWFDAKSMQKVMNNLISNAFKHTKEQGCISISVRKRSEEVIIEVTDNGSGIDPKNINKIFERIYQTDLEATSDPSTSIGLTLTKAIIELHHGTIEVSSALGEGTTFKVRLKTGKTHFTKEQIYEMPDTIESVTNGNLSPEQLQSLLQEDLIVDNDIKEKRANSRFSSWKTKRH
ncbi:two-component system sensor histidine kinase/response regulator, hybrid (one-component system) [gut metagenome]|uniref:histidine kinase n=1 Tax=gut metagenome TaxID=749906 RepID=J9D1L6_9ZZZZ